MESAADRISVFHGDSREVLRGFSDNSFDACVCDPPYALVSIVKRFGKAGSAPAKGNDAYMRASSGFMGQAWDNGETAFDPEFWREVLRVLKPGAHLVAFSGTRTYHRMACGIEDAGFEIRDCLQWIYGSGFPKSHDVSKAIDRADGLTREVIRERYTAKRIKPGATVVAEGAYGKQDVSFTATDTAPASAASAAWQGWGTALKPAVEPICLARKPLSEKTVAANVLRWGTGAINVDGCRIGYENDSADPATNPLYRATAGYRSAGNDDSGSSSYSVKGNGEPSIAHSLGRWPANILHDGSDEVVALFPEADGATSNGRTGKQGLYEDGISASTQQPGFADTGSAARFFYTAKADADDRLGSKHPTVKPVDLMQWLVRLVTPPNGQVLDPFAGTGTTGEAAFREGFRATLIEREERFVADINRRIELMMAGPDERARASIKAKIDDGRIPNDPGPLFAEVAAE